MGASTPENAVKTKIKRWLRANDIFFFSPAAGPYSTHGISDIICCVNGRLLAVEVKAPGKVNNTTANQDLFLVNIRRAGGEAIVADNLEVVIEAVENLRHA